VSDITQHVIGQIADLLKDVEYIHKTSTEEQKDRWSAVAGHLEYALKRARSSH
jgi:hypothetical protein